MSGALRGAPVLVAGAGLTGLAAAVLLAERGARVSVWEPRAYVGGLLAPVPVRGELCDRGAHRVHPSADPLLRGLTREAGWLERPRRGALVLDGRLARYPLAPADFLAALGPRAAGAMALGWLARPSRARAFLRWPRALAERAAGAASDEGFERFVVERVGAAAYARFYRPYAQKVWGVDPGSLSATVARQRVSTERPVRALWASLLRADEPRFGYPAGGMAALLAALRARADALGVAVRFGRAYAPGLAGDARAVLYTGPLEALAPGAGLARRGLYLLYAAVPRAALARPEVDTFYVPDARFVFGRVSRPALFAGRDEGALATLCIEVPEGAHGDACDFTRDAAGLARQLVDAGVLRAGRGAFEHLEQRFEPGVYPLYLRGWRRAWSDALAAVSGQGEVLALGRAGLFLHCNMDHCVTMARDAAAHLDAGGSARAWHAGAARYLALQVRD